MSVYSAYAAEFTLRTHRVFVGDQQRIERYRRAITATVKPGDTVVEIGTGTGILALLAAQAGASHVYGIESDPVVHFARQVAARNGLADRITFLQQLSYDAQIPERADVLIAGHLHNFGIEAQLLSSLVDARERFLKADAVFMPRKIRLSVAPLESANAWDDIDFWRQRHCGLDFSPLAELALGGCYKVGLRPESCLGDPQPLVEFELGRVNSAHLVGAAECTVTTAGLLHGVAGWFSAELSPGVWLTNSPLNPSTQWAQVFFPVSDPTPVKERDRVAIRMSTNNGCVWRWQIEVSGDGQTASPAPASRRKFECSSDLALSLSAEALAKASPAYIPQLSKRGEAAALLLGLIDGKRPSSSVEEEFLRLYSACFPSRRQAAVFYKKMLDQFT
jgi:hypothetical protein